MLNKQKGFEYEIQVRNYLLTIPSNNTWLWSDTPITNLIESGIIDCHNTLRLIRKDYQEELKTNPLIDTGIDIISVDLQSNKYKLIQCKNGYDSGLKLSDLAGFYGWMSHLDSLEGIVYYTSKLSRNILSLPPNPRIKYIIHPYETINHNNQIQENIISDDILSESTNSTKSTKSINSSSSANSTIILYDYQNQALKELKKHFKQNSRGILSLMCGMGKTLISYKFSKRYSKVIIIAPIRQFVKQNLNRFKEYGYIGNTLTISCDGTRHIDTIKDFIKSNDEFLISCTFDSVDVLYKCIKKLDKDLIIIIDEFHNISKSSLTNESNPMYKLLHSDFNILFLSATPRIFELEQEHENEDIEQSDIEELFGKVVYTMGMKDAIEKKIVCDYKIWLPSIHENITKLNEELSIYEIDSVIKAKCNYILICLLNTGSKKTIVYCQDTKQIDLMIKGIEELNKFYYINLQIQQITSKKSEKERDKILDNFVSNDMSKQLLFSVRILDECIDIPQCDSVYLTYPSESKIRTIQRICRSTRINKQNPHKISNVFVWCNEYHEILQTLSGIKEYDIFFKDKINLVKTNFYGKTEPKEYEKDIKLVENYVLGVKEFKQMTWEEKLKELEDWIVENKRMPMISNKINPTEKIKSNWLRHQEWNYNNKVYNLKYDKYRKIFEEFMEKTNSYKKDDLKLWEIKLKKLDEFISRKKRRPLEKSNGLNNILEEGEKELGTWTQSQVKNHNNKIKKFQGTIYETKWIEFTNKYEKYFFSKNDIWIKNYNLLEKFIISHKRKPLTNEKYIIEKIKVEHDNLNIDDEEFILLVENENKLGNWLYSQTKRYNKLNKNNEFDENYNKKDYNLTISYDDFLNNWSIMINKHSNLFQSNESIWDLKCNKFIHFIKMNNNKPSINSINDTEKKLAIWYRNNKKNYFEKNGMMNNNNICKKWDDLIKKYPILN